MKMNSHSKAFEQYCCILKKNIIVIEETTLNNGKRKLICTMKPHCVECKNKILRCYFEQEKSSNTAIDI